MAIFSQLTRPETEMIYDYIYQYGSRSGYNQPIAPLAKILKPWEEAKEQYLHQMMGGELIKTKKISFKKSEEEIANTIREEVTRPYHFTDDDNPCKIFLNAWNELADMLSTEHNDMELYWAMRELVSTNTLAANRIRYKAIDIPLPNEKKYRVLDGAKASKAIGKIALAYGLPKYEEFRIAHSQALNEKSLTGEICMSIHPMDYMTMSDNDCGWGSCMSWTDHGDYRQGTVEMMNSPMVVVVYLKSSTDYVVNKQDNQVWNSKRWRELFIVTRDVIMGVKGYPYWNRDLESIALEWIKETIENSSLEGFGPYTDDILDYDGHDHKIRISTENGSEEIYLDFGTGLMYNDVYDEHQLYIAKDFSRVPDTIYYSGMAECMSCGDRLYDYETESDLYCESCDPVYRCAECGEWHDRDDLYEVDGVLYCEYCYNDYVVECDDCGTPHYYEDLALIHMAKDDSRVCMDKQIHLDDQCLRSGNFFDREAIRVSWGRWHYGIRFVLVDDLTEEGLEAFGFDSKEEAIAYKSHEYYDASENEITN